MPLEPGTTLGRYEIRSKIGKGGMGEVYLAQDTELDRSVAIKILPDELASDKTRVQRFIQEAKAASALNHPNILTVYEIGLTGETRYIATEFIDGETLRQRMEQGLSIADSLDIAIQIASALAAAHSAGIVHRDIKPENILIRKDRYVKVLDFGLAKLTETGAPSTSTDAPTRALVNTEKGVVMGTVKYMSPEQARALAVDERSDIWSLGVVIYEMVAGRSPFEGSTNSDVIVSILDRDPQPLSRGGAGIPGELQRIVRKSLRKSVDDRYQTAKDLAIDLKNLRREMDLQSEWEHSAQPDSLSASRSATVFSANSSTGDGIANQTGAAAEDRRTSSAEYIVGKIGRHKTGILIAVAVGLVLVVGIVIGLYRFVSNGTKSAVGPVAAVPANMKMSRLTTSGKVQNAAISPDGKWVAYVLKDGAKQGLWIRQVATSSIIPIVPPADINIGRETFSPDGNYVYYVADSALYQAPSIGGATRKILTNIGGPITFSPDGSRIAFVRNDESASGEDQLIVANADGTNERKVAARGADKWFAESGCDWSPDGKVIACPGGKYKDGIDLFIIAVDAETGEQKELLNAEFTDTGRASWLSDGSGVVINAADRTSLFDQLWLVPYPSGALHKITNDLNEYGGSSLTSDSKSLVSVEYDYTLGIWTAPVADLTHPKQIANGKFDGGMGSNSGLTWTPDGRIVYVSVANGHSDIWIMNGDGSGQRQLTSDPTKNADPVVSPDGRYIVFVSARHGLPSLWRMDVDGGNVKQLSDHEDYQPHFTPDGKWIIFDSWRSGKRNMWKVPIDGGTPTQLSDIFTSSLGISPDGRSIACFYKENRPGSPWRIMLMSSDGGPPLKTFDVLGGGNRISLNSPITWTPDGRAITYVSSAEGSSNILSQPVDGGPPKKLTEFKDNEVSRYAFSPDGKQIALTRIVTSSDVVLIKDFR
jgi:serine/threonine protein kinase/Tol biopolymer transport system component